MIKLGFGGMGRQKYKNNDRISIFVKAGCWTYKGSFYYSVYCVCLKSPIIKSFLQPHKISEQEILLIQHLKRILTSGPLSPELETLYSLISE